MSTHLQMTHAPGRQNAAHTRTPAKYRSGFLQFVGLLTVCSTLFVLSLTGVARTSALPEIPEPPPAYLPGQPLPEDSSCTWVSYEDDFCTRRFETFDLYFEYRVHLNVIRRTIIPAEEVSIGEPIAAWGTPSGISRADTLIRVHWGNRAAHIYSRHLKPDSAVEYIIYDLEEQEQTPWRGFRRFQP